jgi:hypothetical protein
MPGFTKFRHAITRSNTAVISACVAALEALNAEATVAMSVQANMKKFKETLTG